MWAICSAGCTVVSSSTSCPQHDYISTCVNVTCSHNVTETIQCKTCNTVASVTCYTAIPPYKVFDQDGCCLLHYECPVCVGAHGTPKNIGDTWNNGCRVCTCAEINMEALVLCTNRVCPAELTCSGDNEALQVMDGNDTCCPSTRCGCKRQTCSQSVTSCPQDFELTCANGTASDCCPTYKCTRKPVCIVNDTRYEPGSYIFNVVDPCSECYCSSEVDPSTQLNTVKCEPIRCYTDCQKGFEYKMMPGQCCGKCVQVACTLDSYINTTHVIKPGETWYPYGTTCTSYSCVLAGDQFVLSVAPKTCAPTARQCDQGERPLSCCHQCDPALCKLKEKPIIFFGCNIPINQTMAYCSYDNPTVPDYPPDMYNTELGCKCCKMLTYTTKTVILKLSNGMTMPYTYNSAGSCRCTTCP